VYKYIILYIFSLLSVVTFSQTPCFTTTDTIGCTPFTVTLTDCSGASAMVYIYEENGIKDTTTSSTHTYITGGNHTITQLINSTSGLQSLTKTDYIKTIARPKPGFTLHACEGLQVLIIITNDDYEKYIISYDDGTPNDTVLPFSTTTKTFSDNLIKTIGVLGYYENFDCSNNDSKTVIPIISLEEPQLISLVLNQEPNDFATALKFSTNTLLEYYYEEKTPTSTYQIIDSIQPSTTEVSIIFSNTTPSPYCYRTSSFDRCGNTIQSKEICTIQLAVSSVNNQTELSWTSYEYPIDLLNYTIDKNEEELTSTTSNSFTDTDVECGENYCYQTTTALNFTNSSTGLNVSSTSQIVCVQAISSDIPPQVNNLQSTFTDNQLAIHWDTPSGALINFYSLMEDKNKGEFPDLETFTTTDTTYYVSTTLDETTSLCYKLNYTDICGNNAPDSQPTCPIILSISSDSDNLIHEASWTNYVGSTFDGYWLNMTDQQGNLIERIELGNVLSYSFEWPNDENQIITFSINSAEPAYESYSNNVVLEEETVVLLPNAFTPNEDELNDSFKPVGRFIDNYTISIFNSMGTICFVSTEDQQAWNGKSNQKFVPEGTYYYEMTITDKKGETSTESGSLTVIY